MLEKEQDCLRLFVASVKAHFHNRSKHYQWSGSKQRHVSLLFLQQPGPFSQQTGTAKHQSKLVRHSALHKKNSASSQFLPPPPKKSARGLPIVASAPHWHVPPAKPVPVSLSKNPEVPPGSIVILA